MFRGREVTHPERGTALLDKLAGELSEIAVIEQAPLQDGRNMTMMLAPSKAVLATERPATRTTRPTSASATRHGDEDGGHDRAALADAPDDDDARRRRTRGTTASADEVLDDEAPDAERTDAAEDDLGRTPALADGAAA